jgi:hypothetical protein
MSLKVPDSKSIRFQTETRKKGIEQSANRLGYENLSDWLRECIDLRLYLEQRGYQLKYILSGDFISDLERTISKDREALDKTKDVAFNSGLLSNSPESAELVKMILRTHAIAKVNMRVLLSNPNLNSINKEYTELYKQISGATEEHYMKVFNSDEV